MSIDYSVLQFLELNKGKYISGEEISGMLGVSRNSVWKAVKTLRDKGYDITAVTNKGYMLSAKNRKFSAQTVEKYITDSRIRVDFREQVTSTNTVLKEIAETGEAEGLLLVAAEQTSGKGRRGKSFYSKQGCGVYFSLLLRPDLAPEDSLLITTCAAVATAEAIEKHSGIDAKIKWVNDIYRGDKKIVGILTEAVFDLEAGKPDHAVLGIGINMYIPPETLSDELKDIVGSVFDDEDVSGDTVSRIVADTVNNFMAYYDKLTDKAFIDEYRKRAYLDNKTITVIKPTGDREAVALGIDDDFRLHVRYPDGSEEYLMTGEVSTKVKE